MLDNTIHLNLEGVDATHHLGNVLAQELPGGSILLLDGELGSGKTTLVKAIGKGLAIADPIVSPTFVLVNEYDDGRLPLYHFDLYRLNPSETDALAIEQYWDPMEYTPGIVAIEWADRLPVPPPYALRIHLSFPGSVTQGTSGSDTSDEKRHVTLTLEGKWPFDIQPCWKQLEDIAHSYGEHPHD